MTIKNENQSKNQPQDKIINETNIIESLANFQSALSKINIAVDKLLHQLRLDSIRLKKLREKLRHERVLWPLKDAEEHLSLIILLAAFGKIQYLQCNDSVVQVTNIPEDTAPS